MTPRTPKPNDTVGLPTGFANTTPPISGPDTVGFVLQTVNQLQGTVGGLCKQVEALETSVSELRKEVQSHGKWLHTATVLVVIGVGILGWIGTILADLAKDALKAP